MTVTEPTASSPVLPSDRAALARADFVSQATAVEQARAVAEVQAAIVVARQCPRSTTTAIAQMEESCRQPHLANQAFYSYPRAGQTVAGASVHLARELARCWGNVQYGINELRRDDTGGYSEMQAWAWDVETNTRSSQTFVVPHRRDKRGVKGGEPLIDLRDVYENNANMGARRLREAIFSILPPWFTAKAEAICSATQKEGGGVPLPERRSRAVAAFAELGVGVAQLTEKVGRRPDDWTPLDLAQLTTLASSLTKGTITVEEAFPPAGQRVTRAELEAQVADASASSVVENPVSAPRSTTKRLQPHTDDQPALDTEGGDQ